MKRACGLLLLFICAWGGLVDSSLVQAVSPRQSVLGGPISDFTSDFGGGAGAGLNSAIEVGTSGVLLDFDTDVTDGAEDQVAFEWEMFRGDLSGYSEFMLNVKPGVRVSGAQLFLRSADPSDPENTDFVESGLNGLSAGVENKVRVDLAGVLFPENVVSFGIQLFTNEMSVSNATATLSTAAAVTTTSDVLFSWESGLQGWTEGFQPEHTHSLTSAGATLGTQALQIQRENLLNTTFRWGSEREYDSDPDEDMVLDPVVLAEIADLGQRINAADAIAFDVTINDPIDLVDAGLGGDPTFAGFRLNITDDNSFYQSGEQFFAPVPTSPELHTFEVSLDTLVGAGGEGAGRPLTELGFDEDSAFARFTIATNTDGAGLYQIDNFRLIGETVIASADFDLDSDQDDGDLEIFQAAYGENNDGDADFDGDTDGNDFLIWQRQVGNAPVEETTSVPEPSAISLFMLGCVMAYCRRIRLPRGSV